MYFNVMYRWFTTITKVDLLTDGEWFEKLYFSSFSVDEYIKYVYIILNLV